MYQPFVKFITFALSYVVLVLLVLYSSLQFPSDELNHEQFSVYYPEHYYNYTVYVNNEKLTYRFEVDDFFIRKSRPSISDIIICIWLAGKINVVNKITI